MGCQSPTTCEQAWTPTMESYFIDLMLDHMHRGNRVGHTFNKQAWEDMLTMFVAKFGPKHDKDILKNRYAILWKQFNDIKVLLNQGGFFWDDKKHMVVADNNVWNRYIKAHPGARYYRNKPFMKFSDLCFIYAHTMADGRYSRSSHDTDVDDEMRGHTIGEGKEPHTSTFSNCTRTYWTLAMDHYLIDLLLDQVITGNKIGHAFMTQACNKIVKSFNSKFGSHHDKEDLKSRYKHLRHQYNDVKILLENSGFSWDETREMVIAEEHIWDSYTKACPDALLYKFKTVPSYQKLCVIFDEEGSNGRSTPMDPVWMIDSDYSNTDWIPSMDRHLIDLLLKQVNKGHKINHTVNRQVWIDIVASFNERFKLRHDKYALKDRYKTLKKLYIDMKNLLEMPEFSWDESRQMVRRPDVWNNYAEDHPDQTSFRTRAMPNYNDLSIFYGNLSSEDRLNPSNPYVGSNGDRRDFLASPNGSCPRSGWTPQMDRLLIDLMLEQIRNGNIVDPNFNRKALSDMKVKFIKRFGSQLYEDDVASRFEDLRNLFHDMRTLIDHCGFVWDEMQQMITASDDIWDAFIEEHSRAQSYRGRTLPNYNDLFLIYGNASTDRKGDHPSYYTNLDDDALRLNIGQENDQSSSGGETMSIPWTKPMDRYFIHLMLRQALQGNKSENTFSQQAWDFMVTSFNEKFGLQFNTCVLKDRYLSLMKQFDYISGFANQNGFAWDDIQQELRADDDVWQANTEEHPDIHKDLLLERYNDLSLIFDEAVWVVGRSRYSCPEMDVDDGAALETGMDGINGARCSGSRDTEASSRRKRCQRATPSTSTRRRKAKKTGEEELQDEASQSNRVSKSYNNSSIESIVDALRAIPGMQDELFLDACNLLQDERKAKAFVKMDIPLRKKWLLRNLHG